MYPNVEFTPDPIRPGLLPPTDGMELDYRTQTFPTSLFVTETICDAIALGVIGLMATLALRYCSTLISSTLFLSLSVFITGAIATRHFLHRAPARRWATWVATGPAIWLFTNATTPEYQGLLLAFALLGALALAHAVVTHYAYWMCANPSVGRRERVAWRSIWNVLPWWSHPRGLLALWSPHDVHGGTGSHSTSIEQLEREERRHYGDGFLAVGIAYVFMVLCLLLDPGLLIPGAAAYLVFLALLIGYGFYTLNAKGTPKEVIPAIRVVAAAFFSWLQYNRHQTLAPGVFRSPCGPVSLRRAQFFAVGYLTALTVFPLASYFPIGALMLGPEPWIQASPKPWPWDKTSRRFRAYGLPESRPLQPPSELSLSYLGELPKSHRPEAFKALRRLENEQARVSAGLRSLTARPEDFLTVSFRGALNGDIGVFVSLVLSILLCIVVPPFTLYCVCFALGARILYHFHVTLEEGVDDTAPQYHRAESMPPWEAYVRRLRESRFDTVDEYGHRTRERDLLLVGVNACSDYPVLLEKGILAEHAHIMGDSGSGKSSLGIAPLMAQLIGRPNTSIVVLDLKGDRALFEAARHGVQEANARRNQHRNNKKRIPFRWFTNRTRYSTFAFNPFLQEHIRQVTIQQKASILLQSLGLDYGEGYGRSYFSAVHRNVLTKVLRDDPAICSLRRLQRYFDRDLRTRLRDMNVDRKVYQDASHLFTVVDALASFDALNVTPEADIDESVLHDQIDMSRVVCEPHVVYFYLPSALEEKSVSEIAKLALHSLLTAAVQRGPSKHQVYLFIDEFQQVVSANLEIVLRQARSQGIAVILANHTLADLVTESANLIPTVQTNTRFKQIFAASDPEQQDALIKASGETIFTLWSESWNSLKVKSVTRQDHIGPRLRRNDIIQMGDRMLNCLVHVTRGQGVTQFGGFMFQAITPYHITLEEYDRRRVAPWPEPTKGTLVASADSSIRDEHEVQRDRADQQRVLSEIEKRLQDIE